MIILLDTVTIVSPFLDDFTASAIERECVKRQGINLSTGEVIYELTTGSLDGSYDSRISVVIERSIWVRDLRFRQPIKQKCRPYIILECSIHKALLGHNVYGGPNNFVLSMRWLLSLVEKLLGMKLPSYNEWRVKRIDVAHVYNIGSFAGVQAYIRSLQNSYFPRRSEKISRFGSSGIHVAGSTSVLKFYHKGPEFRKHDRRRLINHKLSLKHIEELQTFADRCLRVEVEIKSRKLIDLFGGSDLPYICDVDDNVLDDFYNSEVSKMIGNVYVNSLPVVNNSRDVSIRLNNLFSKRKARSLLGTWYELSTHGEVVVRNNMSKTTFYQHIKDIKNANISWIGTDVVLLSSDEELYPVDFKPLTNDSRIVNIVHVDVVRKLLSVA